ncbi:glycosyltransferase family 1 protein [Stereum hirsutum FP-91666 SS1]|uniref:glycosyltransferase family 1 protein n=1 Tax=Stereum hirsutum (strain FP-91666) TaxID=721885 RepID=UPI000444A85C|nr:glycosyltransferase family 1 protein [Stereum hirsutum FP-91666 SS1]EIM83096.1 glycosyltransferase family 1 protein [Stereum hirsutum FP-91666 SS1]
MPLILIILVALVVICTRLYIACKAQPIRRPRTTNTCSLAVFLGSGGHTTESLTLLGSLDFSRYTPRTYIVSQGDLLSVQKAIALEASKMEESISQPKPPYTIVTIPRARRVHQPLIATPPTALYSLLIAIWRLTFAPRLLNANLPEVLVLNGPGTCFSLCVAAYLNRFLGIPSPRMVYIESFARVKSLSLSGKLLRSVVDSFVVQWPDLLSDGKRGVYRGWMV